MPRRSSPRPRRPPPPRGRSCARQIAGLERRLSDTLIACLPYGDAAASAPALPARRDTAARPACGPRVLDLGELERRARRARRAPVRRAAPSSTAAASARPAARVRLERMRLDPGRHRFERVARAELGEGRCGVWQVRPRLGLLGMLMGWWEVKLSSGCPWRRAGSTFVQGLSGRGHAAGGRALAGPVRARLPGARHATRGRSR